jgi:hypothetical protein
MEEVEGRLGSIAGESAISLSETGSNSLNLSIRLLNIFSKSQLHKFICSSYFHVISDSFENLLAPATRSETAVNHGLPDFDERPDPPTLSAAAIFHC